MEFEKITMYLLATVFTLTALASIVYVFLTVINGNLF